jgi:hypothetical protein
VFARGCDQGKQSRYINKASSSFLEVTTPADGTRKKIHAKAGLPKLK